MRLHLLYIAILLLPAWSVSAATFKWVDEKGTTHYGDAIPPAYVNQGATELSKKGLVIKKTAPALTPEQRQSRQEEIDLRNEQVHKAREQRRRDNALLNTYTSLSEIDLARDRNLQQLELLHVGAQTRSKLVMARLKEFRVQAAKFKADNKPVPGYLKADMERTQLELERLETSMGKSQQDIEAIKAKFAADRLRYQELTQIAAKPNDVSSAR